MIVQMSDRPTTSEEASSQRPAWWAVVRSASLFQALDDGGLRALLAVADERAVAAGDALVRQGESGDCMFIVLEGRSQAVLQTDNGELVLGEQRPGAVIGEISLLFGGPRSATVRAVEPMRILSLARARFEELVERRPQLLEDFMDTLRQRVHRAELGKHIEELFGRLDSDLLQTLEEQVQWVRLASGDELFRQGDAAEDAYLVVVGRLRVTVGTTEADGGEGVRTLADMGPGQWLGEMALITDSPRSATVHAVRDSGLARLPRAVFESLIVENPAALLATTRQLATRLQRQTSSARPAPPAVRTFALVPAHPGVHVERFARALAREFGRYGTVAYASRGSVERALGKRGVTEFPESHPGRLALRVWLNRQESDHRFVVYECEDGDSGWTQLAIRHSDQVVILADGDSPSDLPAGMATGMATGKSERDDWHGPKVALVLLHRTGSGRYPGTARFLNARRLHAHYHAARGSKADIARIARLLIGEGIRLVLSGGGARGYAHVGVLRAFEELGIPIDAIGGTSMGGLIAGGVADGRDWRDILQNYTRHTDAILDLTLPVLALVSARRVTRGFAEIFGDSCIEDFAIPFFCVSSNLTRAEPLIHRSGPAALAIRATISIPGVFPPVPHNGDLLVDGGLFDNLPVGVMASLYGGTIVAVDATPGADLTAGAVMSADMSGWRYLLRHVLPGRDTGSNPTILGVLARSTVVGSATAASNRAAREQAALFLQPPIGDWGLLQFSSAREIAGQAYRGVRDTIQAWYEQRTKS